MKSIEDRRKTELRRWLLAGRRALSDDEVADKSLFITTRVLQSWEYQQARTVLIYCDFDNEVRTDELIAATMRDGKAVLLPRVNRQAHRLDLYHVEDMAAQVAPGIWNILEPVPERCRPATLDEVECVLAPGVGFDVNGGRLGFGGGYYDRLLNSLTPDQARVAVGLCYELQIVHEVPRGFFDAGVSIVCTEVNLIDYR